MITEQFGTIKYEPSLKLSLVNLEETDTMLLEILDYSRRARIVVALY
jgi:hypothetical protein